MAHPFIRCQVSRHCASKKRNRKKITYLDAKKLNSKRQFFESKTFMTLQIEAITTYQEKQKSGKYLNWSFSRDVAGLLYPHLEWAYSVFLLVSGLMFFSWNVKHCSCLCILPTECSKSQMFQYTKVKWRNKAKRLLLNTCSY